MVLRARRAQEAPVRVALLDERDGSRGAPRSVAISVVEDPAKLLAERSPKLHGDVVDALVDLVVALLDEEDRRDEGSTS